MSLEDYLEQTNEQKFNQFMASRVKTNRTPAYWVDWQKVRKHVAKYRSKLTKLDCLVGSPNIVSKAKIVFTKEPDLLTVIPLLLGTRDMQLSVLVNDPKNYQAYTLDFANPDLKQLDKYLDFIQQTGLFDIMANTIKEPLVNFAYGIEVGLDTNARKNRSGFQNEAILADNLTLIKKEHPTWQVTTQVSGAEIKTNWGITVPEQLDHKHKGGRIYDGAIYNPETNKVTIIETNIYCSNGSKMKAVAGEFSNVFLYLKKHDTKKQVNYVWITDGCGWNTAKNPLREAFNVIPNIFNLKMVKQGYLTAVASK